MKENKERARIIPFPKLASRLVDKGMDSLVHKRFTEAAELLKQAIELKEEDYNARFGLIVALVELSKYQEAKEHCQYILKTGMGDYSKTMEMYVMILLQLNEYDEMEATISALLDEGHLPIEKEEHFENMLEFCRRMNKDQSEFPINESETEEKLDLMNKSTQDQLIKINQLKDENVRKHLDEVKEYLQSIDGHPLIKTLLLLILKEQEIQEECIVEKFSKVKTIVPSIIEGIHSRDFYIETLAFLEKILEQENPSLLDFSHQLLERHHFLLYPFEPSDQYESWAAAYHILAEQYQGLDPNEEEIVAIYEARDEKVSEALSFIQHIEEISSI